MKKLFKRDYIIIIISIQKNIYFMAWRGLTPEFTCKNLMPHVLPCPLRMEEACAPKTAFPGDRP
jgi:hypothetical protein